MDAEALVLAVINDGATYKRRQREIIACKGQALFAGFYSMCERESQKSIYEGKRFTRADIRTASQQVAEYMALHYAESNNGKDWS